MWAKCMPKKVARKNTTQKKQQQQYKKMFKEIRKYVDFSVDLRFLLSPAEKAKITKYHKEFSRMTAGKPYEVQVYRARSKDHLKKAQELGGQNTALKGFKVAFIPKTSPHQKLAFNKKGEAVLKSKFVDAVFIPLDAELLATDNAVDYVEGKIKNRTEKMYSIQAGDYEIGGTFSKGKVGSEVKKLVEKYSDDESNNFYGNWLGGLFAYSFQNQGDLDNYRKRKRDAQVKKDRARRSRERVGRVKIYYWYREDIDSVTVTKSENVPDYYKAITKREYDRFLREGEI